MLVIQSDPDNDSRLATVLVAAITSNTAHAAMPGNVFSSKPNCVAKDDGHSARNS